MREETLRLLGLDLPIDEWAAEEGIADEEIADRLRKQSASKMAARRRIAGRADAAGGESLLLQLLDQTWKEHLLALGHLRRDRSAGLWAERSAGQTRSFRHVRRLLDNLRETVTSVMCHLELSVDAEELAAMGQAQAEMDIQETRMDPPSQTARWRWRVSSTCIRRRKSEAERNTTVLTADTDPADAPPGWELNAALGRWSTPTTRHLGQGAAQRRLPLRVRQEVQAATDG